MNLCAPAKLSSSVCCTMDSMRHSIVVDSFKDSTWLRMQDNKQNKILILLWLDNPNELLSLSLTQFLPSLGIAVITKSTSSYHVISVVCITTKGSDKSGHTLLVLSIRLCIAKVPCYGCFNSLYCKSPDNSLFVSAYSLDANNWALSIWEVSTTVSFLQDLHYTMPKECI